MTRTRFRPVATPRIIEDAYTEDQHRRMLQVVRAHGPWSLILAQQFRTPEEVVATTSGTIPTGTELSWDMFLSPVFRGYFAQGHTALYPEIEDCFFNTRFLDLVRRYWKAEYARPESMLFNIQGPCGGSRNPHVDATRFRGLSYQNTPVWLMNMMVKSGLFKRWQAKKAQVITWYYKGRIGGGFNYWPDGLDGEPRQITAPMWGRAVIVENEMMYHTAEANGPSELRRPAGLDIGSTMRAAPREQDGWQIVANGKVIQTVPPDEFRFLIHWGADIFMDYTDLKVALDHRDDISHEQVFDMLIKDLRDRGETFETPTDPLHDAQFVTLLTRVYDPGIPSFYPAEPIELMA